MGQAQPAARGRATRRPAEERRRQLALAAADAFHRRGFHRVTVAGVAAAVGVSPPAVYRHFDSKNALLAEAVDTGLQDVGGAIATAAPTLPAILDELAGAALRRPDFWTLLQREVRHLDPLTQRRVRAAFRSTVAPVDAALAATRPELDAAARELLVTAAMAAMATPSAHEVPMATTRQRRWLTAAAAAVCRTALRPANGDGGRRHDPEPATSRSGAILDAAVSLFHRHGYAAVGIEDVGAAVGMAGPSVYHHFPTKADLLGGAADRILERLPVAGDDLDAAVRAYVAMAVGHRESLGLYVTERLHLAATAARRVARAAAADRDRWTGSLRRRRPDLDHAAAGFLVDAARTVVHDVVRTGRLHRRPGIEDDLVALVTAVLDAPAPPGGLSPRD